MNAAIGEYVKYKDTVRLVTQLFAADSVRLQNPTLLGSNANVVVSTKNITHTTLRPAVVVTHSMNDYVVTAKGVIISLKTHKVMKWSSTDANRRGIMQLVGVL